MAGLFLLPKESQIKRGGEYICKNIEFILYFYIELP